MKSALIAAASASSTKLVLPPSPLERTVPTGRLANGKGERAMRWIVARGQQKKDRVGRLIPIAVNNPLSGRTAASRVR